MSIYSNVNMYELYTGANIFTDKKLNRSESIAICYIMLEGKRINLLYLGIRKKSDDTQQMLDAAQRAPQVSESVD